MYPSTLLGTTSVGESQHDLIVHSLTTHTKSNKLLPMQAVSCCDASNWPTHLDSCQLSIPVLDRWAMDELWHTDNGQHVTQAITQGTALIISDGSYKNDRGTSAFLLQGPSKELQRILGVNRTPGSASDQSPYRAELSGISGILLVLSVLCKIHDITEGSICLGLDGDSTMKEASGAHPLHADQPSFDLLSDIRH
jgi:hypothetical protein